MGEFHYNFIIFFAFGFHDSIQKISISFYPLYPSKNDYFCKIWPFWHFLVLFGFFLPRRTPKKNQKMTILTKFGHFGTSWHCSDLFLPPIPPKNRKNDYFGKIWPFWHFLALFGGGSKLPKKR